MRMIILIFQKLKNQIKLSTSKKLSNLTLVYGIKYLDQNLIKYIFFIKIDVI